MGNKTMKKVLTLCVLLSCGFGSGHPLMTQKPWPTLPRNSKLIEEIIADGRRLKEWEVQRIVDAFTDEEALSIRLHSDQLFEGSKSNFLAMCIEKTKSLFVTVNFEEITLDTPNFMDLDSNETDVRWRFSKEEAKSGSWEILTWSQLIIPNPLEFVNELKRHNHLILEASLPERGVVRSLYLYKHEPGPGLGEVLAACTKE